MFSMPPKELFQLGLNARKEIITNYSINNIAIQYKNIYSTAYL